MPNWVETLCQNNQAQSLNADNEPSYDEQAIQHFIATHFSFEESDRAMLTDENINHYRFLHADIAFTETELHALINFMKAHHFDGALYDAEYQPSSESLAVQSLIAAKKVLMQNIRPTAFVFQLLNLLEVTALLSAIWEKDKNFFPGPGLFSWLAVVALFTLRNNHYFASVIGEFSREKMIQIKINIEDQTRDLLNELAKLTPGVEGVDINTILLRLLTKPLRHERILQELSSWIAYTVKLSATAAVFLEEFKLWPLHLTLFAATIAGTIQGVDSSYTMYNAINGEHRKILEYRAGKIPVQYTPDRALFFPKFSDFPVIPWMMAKLGPAIWTAVKLRAAVTLIRLLKLESADVPGGLYGFYGIAFASALYTSCVFSLYGIDQKLAKELPTQRNFQYTHTLDRHSIATATLGALPISAMVAYGMHLANYDNKSALIAALPAWSATTVLILNFPVFAHFYRQIVEMRYVDSLMHHLDHLPTNDKFMLFVLSALATAGGIGWDKPALAVPGEIAVFLTFTAWIAQCARPTASYLRYTVAQSVLYATALVTWILNCAIPFYNLNTHQDPADRPAHLDESYFHTAGYFMIVSMGLFACFGAAHRDWKATAAKIPALTGKIDTDNQETRSVIFRPLSWMCNKLIKCVTPEPGTRLTF